MSTCAICGAQLVELERWRVTHEQLVWIVCDHHRAELLNELDGAIARRIR